MNNYVERWPKWTGGRHLKSRRDTWFAFAVGLTVCILASIIGVTIHSHFANPSRSLPYYAHFGTGAEDHWTAYGGTWEVVNGSMRNDSDERGAKLITGSTYWSDYSVEADIQLLGLGDAGLITRASDAEFGVDAYSGYYAGLRTMDESLILGRVQHGWQEYPLKQMPGGVQPFRWYHLMVIVSGCRLTAVASVPGSALKARVSEDLGHCLTSGRIGLRSYSSGGVWRNVVVRPLTSGGEPTFANTAVSPHLPEPDGLSTQRSILASYVANKSASASDVVVPSASVQPISSLRFVSPFHPPEVAVRGVVVLKSPELYVQDPTGGVSVRAVKSPTLKIGDEVEIAGRAEPAGFSAVLKDARIRVLWEASPGPPLSVTANQAATGTYDAMFVQVEGSLTKKSTLGDGTRVFDLKSGSQTFRALLNPGRSASHFANLSADSILRLRGICVVDSKYTHNMTPFVLLVRSTEDVEVVTGPPWWSPNTLIPLGMVVIVLAGAAYILYIRAKHWRLHAVVEERSRLAHEIHDTLAQSFAGIAFQLQAISNSMPANVPRLEQQVHLACDLVRHSHEEARRSIASLRPESLEAEGLAAALKKFAERMVQHGAVAVKVATEGNAANAPLRIKDTLFRIGQEAIANAIRHADAKTLEIRVGQDRSAIRLVIKDDGRGFSTESELRGFGLIGMKRRADSISAQINVSSTPGSGTAVEVIAPIPDRLNLVWPRLIWSFQKAHAERDNPYSYSG